MGKARGMIEFIMTYGWVFLVVLIFIGVLAYFGVFPYSELLLCKNNPEKCVCLKLKDGVGQEESIRKSIRDGTLNYDYLCTEFREKTPEELEVDYCNENPDDGTMCNVISEECHNIVRSEAGNWEVSVPIEERFCKDICSKSKRTKSCEEFFTEHNLSLYGTIKELHEKELTLIGF